jgi:hypothetical protein
MAGLIHTFLSPEVVPLIFSELRAVYDGPVVQQRVAYTPVLPTPPDWWADARIPLDDVT